ncbi:unnamed protein product [Camellia sinensis]
MITIFKKEESTRMSDRRDTGKVLNDEEEEEREKMEEDVDIIPRPRRTSFTMPPPRPPTSARPATDKQGKKIKEEDAEEEEEKKKAKQVSKEGNPPSSSSTPLEETATETEGSDEKMTLKPSAEGNVDVPFKKLTIHDDADVLPQSKSGASCSSEMANQALQDTDGRFNSSGFLFELQLTPRDIQQGQLFIPVVKAANHFPPILTHPPNYEHQIEISDTQNRNWNMILVYHNMLGAFIIKKGWHRFVVGHGLEAMDVICFYKPLLRLHDKHFLIQHVKREESETDNRPEFKPENFLFELRLTTSCAGDRWLVLPKEKVRNHFPALNNPAGRKLNFTDARNKDWTMTFFFVKDLGVYMLIDGWEEFVKKHGLEAQDVIRFYKPVQPLHEGHLLIECVKKKDYEENAGKGGDHVKQGSRSKVMSICCLT